MMDHSAAACKSSTGLGLFQEALGSDEKAHTVASSATQPSSTKQGEQKTKTKKKKKKKKKAKKLSAGDRFKLRLAEKRSTEERSKAMKKKKAKKKRREAIAQGDGMGHLMYEERIGGGRSYFLSDVD